MNKNHLRTRAGEESSMPTLRGEFNGRSYALIDEGDGRKTEHD
jgi:hypothetical protein